MELQLENLNSSVFPKAKIRVSWKSKLHTHQQPTTLQFINFKVLKPSFLFITLSLSSLTLSLALSLPQKHTLYIYLSIYISPSLVHTRTLSLSLSLSFSLTHLLSPTNFTTWALNQINVSKCGYQYAYISSFHQLDILKVAPSKKKYF